MSDRPSEEHPIDFRELLADPMIRLIMQADGIGERELRDICEHMAVDIKGRQENAPPEVAAQPYPDGESSFRRGIGIMLVNSAGHVFVGQRCDMLGEAWQMPQGGIEHGETPLAAALRELREEVGTQNITVMVATEDWLSYEFPPELLALVPATKWKGQTQKWFLMRFLGDDTEIRIATEHPEFSEWKWVVVSDLIGLIVPFKRELYRSVIREFAPYLA